METSLEEMFTKANSEKKGQLICNICNRYLSIAPIYCNKVLGNICGRCQDSEEVLEILKLKSNDSFLERQRVYETIAKYLIFPCSFELNGCLAKLKWDEVVRHEEDCIYQKTPCFLSNDDFSEEEQCPCEWRGQPGDMGTHFLSKHFNYFTQGTSSRIVLGVEGFSVLGPLFGTDGITYEPKFKSKLHCLEAFDSIIFILLYYFKESSFYSFQIFTDVSHHQAMSLEYQAEIFDDNKKHSILLPKTEIVSLRNCFLNVSDGTKIDMSYMNKLLKMPHFLMVDFRIFKKSAVPTMKLRHVKLDNWCYDENLLESMKCDVCTSYFLSAVHYCTNGHNVCEPCIEKVENNGRCIICRSSWCSTRNKALEKLSKLLQFPCKNRQGGCSYVAPLAHLALHQVACTKLSPNNSRSCFLKDCHWHGSKYLVHVKENHTLLETSKLYRVKDQNCFLMFDDHIFALQMNLIADEQFQYMIVCCDSQEVKYRYELQLKDATTNKNVYSLITLSQICEPEYSLANEFTEIVLPFTLIPQFFLNHHKLLFKIEIIRLDFET